MTRETAMGQKIAGVRGVPLEFWYDFASPYAYLAASRIEALVSATGAAPPIHLAWRPFLLGPIFRRRAANPSPFQEAGPEERRYRHRDIERLCHLYGLALKWPSTYPRGSLLAARVTLVAAEEGWGGAFTRAVFHANFVEDRDIAAEGVVAAILRDLGRDADPILARATAPEVKAKLAAQVEQAIAIGIFGAPSFIAGDGELFWGNDRLEQAIAWAVAAGAGAPAESGNLRARE